MAGHKFDFGDSQKMQVLFLFFDITSERVKLMKIIEKMQKEHSEYVNHYSVY